MTKAPGSRVLYQDAALADGTGPVLRVGVSVLVEGGRVVWIRSSADEPSVEDAKIVDAGGATIVPGMVDCHSHLTLPGGSHWIDRVPDPPERLVEEAEHNGRLLSQAGVRWARDVGSPQGVDPVDGRKRALALGVRDRWRNRADLPYIRAAGTWIAAPSTLPEGLSINAADADGLVAVARGQLEDGADLLKLYLDGPKPDAPPWTEEAVGRVVQLAHDRGAKVTAHSTTLAGAWVGVRAGVDSIEHGFEIDRDLARLMAERGTFLVSTLAVFRSWHTFARTTRLDRFTREEDRQKISKRQARAVESLQTAHHSSVKIAAGTDFGGGSLRANQLAWEVEALVDAGLEPWEALGAATYRGGQLLGVPDAGVLREGGPADFFLVHGDPLTDPPSLWRVWKVGWST